MESESQSDFLADEVAFLVTANGSICGDWKWGDFGKIVTELSQIGKMILRQFSDLLKGRNYL